MDYEFLALLGRDVEFLVLLDNPDMPNEVLPSCPLWTLKLCFSVTIVSRSNREMLAGSRNISPELGCSVPLQGNGPHW